MKLSFIEKYGLWIAFLLLSFSAWKAVTLGIHQTESYALLFPLNWLQYSTFTEYTDPYIEKFQAAPYWMWAHIGTTIVTWVLIFIFLRGGFYYCHEQEGFSMWVMFVLYTIAVFALFAFLMEPVRVQLVDWWYDWPGIERVQYPDG